MNANAISPPPLPGSLSAPTSSENADGTQAFLGSILRLPFVLLGAGLLVCTLLLACGLALDLPGLIESGRLDPHMPHELRREFGSAQWPEAMRFTIAAVLFACEIAGSAIWMLARRRHGGVHIVPCCSRSRRRIRST
jgi:hypothetical protein